MNKEIEELLNKIKNAIKKHKEEDLQDDMLVILELDVIQWQLLLSHIEQLENLCNKYEQEHKTTFEIWKKDIKESEQLEKENKILRENAEHNDKVVDKVNWEINVLKHNRDKALKFIKENSYKKGDGTIMYDTDIQKLEDILKGDSDE